MLSSTCMIMLFKTRRRLSNCCYHSSGLVWCGEDQIVLRFEISGNRWCRSWQGWLRGDWNMVPERGQSWNSARLDHPRGQPIPPCHSEGNKVVWQQLFGWGSERLIVIGNVYSSLCILGIKATLVFRTDDFEPRSMLVPNRWFGLLSQRVKATCFKERGHSDDSIDTSCDWIRKSLHPQMSTFNIIRHGKVRNFMQMGKLVSCLRMLWAWRTK